jgi:DNA-binding transcriptional MerR regulator
MSITYSISDLSGQFDITARTIRFYEDQSLLSPGRQGTRRIYSERERVRLKLILRAKRLGFTLSEIRETLDLYDSEFGEVAQMHYVLGVISNHRSILLQQQSDIKDVLQEMKAVESRIIKKMKVSAK